ncbi:MAG TPA: helix-turn-helix domain-containing protein [Thermoleophilaceae bacterium]|nr:helix-turn-helix domain-containing protein [Thermoleophilaceae bacterium]
MSSPIPERPWSALPAHVPDVLRPELPAVADEIIAAISHGVPDYARPLEGPFGAGLRAGVEQALGRFLELAGRTEPGPDSGRQAYVDLGRGEMRAGRRLEALLAAYRLGARVAWRRLAAAGEGAGLEPHTLYLLAESIFAYIDELSGESVEGYAMEQAAVAGTQQRRRRELAALLIQEPPVDPAVVEAAALDAGWTLPARVAAVYVDEADPDRLALRLAGGAIAADLAAGACAVVPDPDAPGRRMQLEAAFKDRLGALGPTVPWRDAHVSAARARAALHLAVGGTIAGSDVGLIVAADHPVALLVNADRRLARDLAAAALAPLDGETPASRERLLETLSAWLRHRGRTEAVAAALHVHSQTVRYRLGRLRELYGERLDDPDARFQLELALRSRAADEI